MPDTYLDKSVVGFDSTDDLKTQVDTYSRLSSILNPKFAPALTGKEPSILRDNTFSQAQTQGPKSDLPDITVQQALSSDDPHIRAIGSQILDKQTQAIPEYNLGLGRTIETPYKEGKKFVTKDYGFSALRDNEDFYHELDYQDPSFLSGVGLGAKNTLKFFGRVIGQSVLKLGEGLGYLGSMITSIGSDNYMQSVADNEFSKTLTEAEDYLKDQIIPVYKKAGFDEKGFFSKLQDSSFWNDSVADGVAFMLAQVADTFLMGNVGKIGLLGKIGRTTLPGILKVATGSEDVAGAIGLVRRVVGESAFEAADGFKQVKEQLLQERKKGLNEFSDEEINTKAGEQAAGRFQNNLAILGASGVFENRFIFQPLKNKFKGLSPTARPQNNSIDIAQDLTASKKAYNYTTKLGKYTNYKDPQGRFQFYGKRTLGATIAEGYWEENAQLASERMHNNKNTYEGFWSQLIGQSKDATVGNDTEAAESIGLGALIGIGGTNIISKFVQNERQENILSRDRQIDNLNQTRASFLSINDIYEIDPITNLPSTNPDGSFIVDEAKSKAVLQGLGRFSDDLAVLDTIEDPIFRESVRNNLLSDYTYAAIKSGTINKVLDRLGNFNKDDFSNYNIDPTTIENPSTLAQKVKEYQDIYDISESSSSVKPKDMLPQDFQDLEVSRKYILYQALTQNKNAKDLKDIVSSSIAEDNKSPIFDSTIQEYNTLQFQQAGLDQFDEYSRQNSSFYSEYVKDQKSEISKRLQEIEDSLKEKLDKKEIFKDPNGLIYPKGSYRGQTDLERGISLSLNLNNFKKLAELTNSERQWEFLSNKLQDKQFALDNLKAFQEHNKKAADKDAIVEQQAEVATQEAINQQPEPAQLPPPQVEGSKTETKIEAKTEPESNFIPSLDGEEPNLSEQGEGGISTNKIPDIPQDILFIVGSEENYKAWSNIRDKSDYLQFLEQIDFALSQFDKVQDKSILHKENISNALQQHKVFQSKDIRDKVSDILVKKYQKQAPALQKVKESKAIPFTTEEAIKEKGKELYLAGLFGTSITDKSQFTKDKKFLRVVTDSRFLPSIVEIVTMTGESYSYKFMSGFLGAGTNQSSDVPFPQFIDGKGKLFSNGSPESAGRFYEIPNIDLKNKAELANTLVANSRSMASNSVASPVGIKNNNADSFSRELTLKYYDLNFNVKEAKVSFPDTTMYEAIATFLRNEYNKELGVQPDSLEAKQADIKRRREEEKNDVERKGKSYADLEALSSKYDIALPTIGGNKLVNAVLGSDLSRSEIDNFLDAIIAKVDLKYDAELAALNPTPEVSKSNIVTGYQGTLNSVDDRQFNYYTTNRNEALGYGPNINTVEVDLSNFLRKRIKDGSYLKRNPVLSEIERELGMVFDILDNSSEGLKNQARFFKTMQDRGYAGYTELVEGLEDQDENLYFVTFGKVAIPEKEEPAPVVKIEEISNSEEADLNLGDINTINTQNPIASQTPLKSTADQTDYRSNPDKEILYDDDYSQALAEFIKNLEFYTKDTQAIITSDKIDWIDRLREDTPNQKQYKEGLRAGTNPFGQVILFKKGDKYLKLGDFPSFKKNFPKLNQDLPFVIAFNSTSFDSNIAYRALIKSQTEESSPEEALQYFEDQKLRAQNVRAFLKENPTSEVSIELGPSTVGVYPRTDNFVPFEERFGKYTIKIVDKDSPKTLKKYKEGTIVADMTKGKNLPVTTNSLSKSTAWQTIQDLMNFNYSEYASREDAEKVKAYLNKLIYATDKKGFVILKDNTLRYNPDFTKPADASLEQNIELIGNLKINANNKFLQGKDVFTVYSIENNTLVPKQLTKEEYKTFLKSNIITNIKRVESKDGTLHTERVNPYFTFQITDPQFSKAPTKPKSEQYKRYKEQLDQKTTLPQDKKIQILEAISKNDKLSPDERQELTSLAMSKTEEIQNTDNKILSFLPVPNEVGYMSFYHNGNPVFTIKTKNGFYYRVELEDGQASISQYDPKWDHWVFSTSEESINILKRLNEKIPITEGETVTVRPDFKFTPTYDVLSNTEYITKMYNRSVAEGTLDSENFKRGDFTSHINEIDWPTVVGINRSDYLNESGMFKTQELEDKYFQDVADKVTEYVSKRGIPLQTPKKLTSLGLIGPGGETELQKAERERVRKEEEKSSQSTIEDLDYTPPTVEGFKDFLSIKKKEPKKSQKFPTFGEKEMKVPENVDDFLNNLPKKEIKFGKVEQDVETKFTTEEGYSIDFKTGDIKGFMGIRPQGEQIKVILQAIDGENGFTYRELTSKDGVKYHSLAKKGQENVITIDDKGRGVDPSFLDLTPESEAQLNEQFNTNCK